MSKIGIVTVLYNSEKVLDDFFRTLDQQTYKDFTLYVVDNASSDSGLKKARELAEEVSFRTIFFPEPENWGIAKGNNIGIKAALEDGCEYVLLSNNDVVLEDNTTVEKMVERMDDDSIGIITPKILLYSDKNIIWAAGGKFKKPEVGIKHLGAYKNDALVYNIEKQIDYSPTCFVIIRKKVFEDIGIMDESFFVYCDDTDFMYRVKKAGINMLYMPSTYILHNESSCTGPGSSFKLYQISKNQLIYVYKHFNKFIYCGLIMRNLIAHYLKHTFTFDKNQKEAALRGIFDGIAYNKRGKQS